VNGFIIDGSNWDYESLITKYNDGYVKDEKGHPHEKGYPDSWKNDVLNLEPEKFKIPEWNNENNPEGLPY